MGNPYSAGASQDLLGCKFDDGRLLVLEHLARGSFGAVYRVWDYADGQEYALKVIYPTEATDGASRDAQLGALMEVAAHTIAAQHGHPGILKLIRTFIEPAHGVVCIVLEYCEGGSLYSAVSQGVFWSDAHRVRVALLQILDALIHCHDQGMAHRDLKVCTVFQIYAITCANADYSQRIFSYLSIISALSSPTSVSRLSMHRLARVSEREASPFSLQVSSHLLTNVWKRC